MSAFFKYLTGGKKKEPEQSQTAKTEPNAPKKEEENKPQVNEDTTSNVASTQENMSTSTQQQYIPQEVDFTNQENYSTTDKPKKSFGFIKNKKKKEESGNDSNPTTTASNQNITNEGNDDDKKETTSVTESKVSEPAKKGFGFIKKTKTNNDIKIEENKNIDNNQVSSTSLNRENKDVDPYAILNSVDFDAQKALSQENLDQSISNNPQSEVNKPSEASTTKVNDTQASSTTTKKFGFIKKKKQDEDDKLSQTGSVSAVNKLRNELASDHKEHIIKTNNENDDSVSISASATGYQEEQKKQSKNRLISVSQNSASKEFPSAKQNTPNSPEALKKHCTREIQRNHDQLNEIYSAINKLKHSIHELNSQIKSKQDTLDKTSEAIDNAISQDDYALAAELDERSNSIRSQIEKLTGKKSDLNKELIQLRERELIAYKGILNSYSEVSKNFNQLKDHVAKEIEDFQLKDVSKHKNDQFKIKKLKEKLENMQQNIDASKEDIEKEEEKINGLIKNQSKDIFEERDVLFMERAQALEEIEELKRKLEEKQALVEDLNTKIEDKENEIDAIRSNFKPEFKKLNAKKKYFEEESKDFQEQLEQLKNMQDKLKQTEEENSNKIQSLNLKSQEYLEDSEKYKQLIDKTTKEINIMNELMKKENELHSRLFLLKMTFEENKKSIESNRKEIDLLEMNNKTNESEVIGYDLKVPALEEEKVKYVSSKNFKEAGRVNNELKKIGELKAACIEKIRINKENIKSLNEKTEELTDAESKTTKDIETCSKEIDCITYENLKLYEGNLRILIKELSKSDLPSNKKRIESLNSGLDLVNEELMTLELLSHIQEKFVKPLEDELNKKINKLSPNKNQEEEINGINSNEDNSQSPIKSIAKSIDISPNKHFTVIDKLETGLTKV